VMVFDQTPMYAEGGGQTGDRWRVELDTGELLEIKDVHKYGGVWLHFVR
jgi:alanyl-tRNA synthetase